MIGLTTPLLDLEPRQRKVKGYTYLRQLRAAIRREIQRREPRQEMQKVAEAA